MSETRTTPPTGTPASSKVADRPHGGLGDTLRLWWDALARPTQWLVGSPFIVFIALLPVLNLPVLTTVGTNFGAVMAQFGMYALIAIGLNVVVGQAGLLDLGYVGFYAVGAYTVAILTSPSSPWNQTGDGGWLSRDWAWLAALPIAVAITAMSGLRCACAGTTSRSSPSASVRSSGCSLTTSTRSPAADAASPRSPTPASGSARRTRTGCSPKERRRARSTAA